MQHKYDLRLIGIDDNKRADLDDDYRSKIIKANI